MTRPMLRLLALSVALGSCAACKSDGPKLPPTPARAAAPAVIIDADGRNVMFRVEVAVSPEEHARGLMYRTRLAPDAGMIFVFEQPEVQRFWMKNTLIPLDMVFIGADRRVVGVVEDAAPETTTERSVPAPSQFVLEIGGGLAGKLGIHAGEAVDLRDVPAP